MFLNISRNHVRQLACLKKHQPSLCENTRLLRMFSSTVKEFTSAIKKSKKLFINVSCNLNIKPLDPESQADDCFTAKVYGPQNCDFMIDLKENDESYLLSARPTQSKDYSENAIEIGLPVRQDVDISSKSGNVSVGSFISDSITVHAENGDINCKKLLCSSLLFKSSNGNVNCEGLIIGNIRMKTGKHGNINGLNFQGSRLEVETEDGDICISSVYSDESYFTTKNGNINLKNLHRKSRISVEEGNVSIRGLDGSLDGRVQRGDLSVQISGLHGDSYLETKRGDIYLSLAKDDVCQLDLSSKKISIEGNLNSIGKICDEENIQHLRSHPTKNCNESVMKAVSETGELSLKEESWISSLKFGAN